MHGNKRATRKGYEPHRVADLDVPRERPKKSKKALIKKNKNKNVRGKEFRARQVKHFREGGSVRVSERAGRREKDGVKGLPYARIMFHPRTIRPTGNNRKFVGIIIGRRKSRGTSLSVKRPCSQILESLR